MKLAPQKLEEWDCGMVKISRSYLWPFLYDTPFYRWMGNSMLSHAKYHTSR